MAEDFFGYLARVCEGGHPMLELAASNIGHVAKQYAKRRDWDTALDLLEVVRGIYEIMGKDLPDYFRHALDYTDRAWQAARGLYRHPYYWREPETVWSYYPEHWTAADLRGYLHRRSWT